MLKTPSPIRMAANSYFATPGVPGTPLTESMQLAAWLRETSAKTSAQARAVPVIAGDPTSRRSGSMMLQTAVCAFEMAILVWSVGGVEAGRYVPCKPSRLHRRF